MALSHLCRGAICGSTFRLSVSSSPGPVALREEMHTRVEKFKVSRPGAKQGVPGVCRRTKYVRPVEREGGAREIDGDMKGMGSFSARGGGDASAGCDVFAP